VLSGGGSYSESESQTESSSGSGGSSYDSSDYSYTPSSPSTVPREPSNIGTLVAAAVIVFALIALIGSLTNSQERSTSHGITGESETANVIPPPEQIVDRGACPYESCQYGEKWKARQDVTVYAQPPSALGADPSALKEAATIPAHDWVETETGLVLAKRHEGRAVRGTTYGVVVRNMPPLYMGQIIPLYSYLGEGCLTAWIANRSVVVCGAEYNVANFKAEWWIKLRLADGSEAWTNSPQLFATQEKLNSEIGEVIANPDLALEEKLAGVDALIAEGADLNGNSTRHLASPIEAAFNSGDTNLITQLMARGLNLQNGDSPQSDVSPNNRTYFQTRGSGIRFGAACPAASATSAVLKPEGDRILEFLLKNGMQLGCLAEPPVMAFLRLGIATDHYPVEEAIKVAAVLAAIGVPVRQPDSGGKTIFDLLEEPDVAKHSHASKLREALLELEKRQAVLADKR